MLSGNMQLRVKNGKVQRRSFFSQSNQQASNANNESVLKKRPFSETRLNNVNTYCSSNKNDNTKNSIVEAESTNTSNNLNGNNDFDSIFENHDVNNISSDDDDVINGQYSLQRVCNMKFMFLCCFSCFQI